MAVTSTEVVAFKKAAFMGFCYVTRTYGLPVGITQRSVFRDPLKFQE
jgi:hypothetical protein